MATRRRRQPKEIEAEPSGWSRQITEARDRFIVALLVALAMAAGKMCWAWVVDVTAMIDKYDALDERVRRIEARTPTDPRLP